MRPAPDSFTLLSNGSKTPTTTRAKKSIKNQKYKWKTWNGFHSMPFDVGKLNHFIACSVHVCCFFFCCCNRYCVDYNVCWLNRKCWNWWLNFIVGRIPFQLCHTIKNTSRCNEIGWIEKKIRRIVPLYTVDRTSPHKVCKSKFEKYIPYPLLCCSMMTMQNKGQSRKNGKTIRTNPFERNMTKKDITIPTKNMTKANNLKKNRSHHSLKHPLNCFFFRIAPKKLVCLQFATSVKR